MNVFNNILIGTVSSLNYDDFKMKNCSFKNSKSQVGGHVSLLYGSTASFDKVIFD